MNWNLGLIWQVNYMAKMYLKINFYGSKYIISHTTKILIIFLLLKPKFLSSFFLNKPYSLCNLIAANLSQTFIHYFLPYIWCGHIISMLTLQLLKGNFLSKQKASFVLQSPIIAHFPPCCTTSNTMLLLLEVMSGG